MKNCYWLLVAFVLVAGSVMAQKAYVPDSNPAAGSNNIWPWDMSSTTGRFIQILDAKYLPNAPVKITEVAFTRHSRFSRNTSFFAKQFQMRMSHTTSKCPLSLKFADHCAPCPTNLIDTSSGFTYSLPTGDTWVDIGTHCDFGYDGKRNICLEVRFRGQNTALGFVGWADGSGTPRLMSKLTTIDNYNAPVGSNTWCTNGLKVCLTYDKRCILLAPDTAKIGGSTPIQLINMPVGQFYQIAASFGQTPLTLGNCTICLNPDAIFWASIFGGPPIFNGYAGVVPSGGSTAGKFSVPNIPVLAGICVYHAAIAFGKGGIICCTNTAGSELAP